MGTFKKLQQEFEEALGNLDFGHGMTWTDKGSDIDGMPYFSWHDSNSLMLTYYLVVYLQWDGSMMIKYAYPGIDDTWQDFDPGEYDKVKDFILNYFDNTEREENNND